jgi:hypothetical protein
MTTTLSLTPPCACKRDKDDYSPVDVRVTVIGEPDAQSLFFHCQSCGAVFVPATDTEGNYVFRPIPYLVGPIEETRIALKALAEPFIRPGDLFSETPDGASPAE